jgi:DNA-binding transcriptional LysR family regulator
MLLASFHQQYPQVRATCHVFPQQQIHRMISDDRVQFALSSAPLGFTHEIEFHKFMQDEILMIAPSDHPWVQRKEIEPEELVEGVFILREDDSGTQMAVRMALANAGVSTNQLNTLLTLGNSEAIALAVQQGLGIGFVSQIVVSRAGQGNVVPIRIRGVEIYRDIFIGRSTRRQFTAAQSAFWDFIMSRGSPIIEQIRSKELVNT